MTGLEKALERELRDLETRGVLKGDEKVTVGLRPGSPGKGPRWLLSGEGDREFLKMNSNSYLGLGLEGTVAAAADEAARSLGTGPGAVRFISGTFSSHVKLERKLARFHGREAAMIFSSAYGAVLGVLSPLITGETLVVSDELNHNSIINALRLSRPAAKVLYPHCDLKAMEEGIASHVGRAKRHTLGKQSGRI